VSQSFASQALLNTLPPHSPAFTATHLDSKISLSLARVLIDTLREISPRMRKRIDDKIAEEVRALRLEADLHFDVLSDAAATIIEHSFEDLIVAPVSAAYVPPHEHLHAAPTQAAAPRRERIDIGVA
jgi:hypothetical protein